MRSCFHAEYALFTLWLMPENKPQAEKLLVYKADEHSCLFGANKKGLVASTVALITI